VNEFAQSAKSALDLIVHADAVLVRIVALSLAVSGTACLFAAGFGLVGGAWLAVARFPGLRVALLLLNTLLALPSVVVGLASTCCFRAAARSARGASCSRRPRW
jgi:ABC-type tungstate transport system substrate-binding protein